MKYANLQFSPTSIAISIPPKELNGGFAQHVGQCMDSANTLVNDVGAKGVVLFGQGQTFRLTDRLRNSELDDALGTFRLDKNGKPWKKKI
jgi:hypothetical protein